MYGISLSPNTMGDDKNSPSFASIWIQTSLGCTPPLRPLSNIPGPFLHFLVFWIKSSFWVTFRVCHIFCVLWWLITRLKEWMQDQFIFKSCSHVPSALKLNYDSISPYKNWIMSSMKPIYFFDATFRRISLYWH